MRKEEEPEDEKKINIIKMNEEEKKGEKNRKKGKCS